MEIPKNSNFEQKGNGYVLKNDSSKNAFVPNHALMNIGRESSPMPVYQPPIK